VVLFRRYPSQVGLSAGTSLYTASPLTVITMVFNGGVTVPHLGWTHAAFRIPEIRNFTWRVKERERP